MKELPHTRSCFVCGESNPAGLNLRFETDGEQVHTRFLPGRAHVGFRETVHGGLLATILDEIMVWACAVKTRRFAYCAELNVRFVRPLQPGRPVRVRGALVADKRGRLFEAESEILSDEDEVIARASGKYIPIGQDEASDMADDFVSDTGWVFSPQKI